MDEVDEKRKKYLSIFYDNVKLMLFSLVWVELIFVSSLVRFLLDVFLYSMSCCFLFLQSVHSHVGGR